MDETCLPFKMYLGHVMWLTDKCDAIFIPRMGGYSSREKMCTRFEALPDLAANIFRDEQIRILTVSYDWYEKTTEEKVYLELGESLGRPRKQVKKALCRRQKAAGYLAEDTGKKAAKEPGQRQI